MAGTVHENVKVSLLKALRDTLIAKGLDPFFAEPEWRIYFKGKTNLIDVAFRNLKLVCEVEPSSSDKATGFKQLRDYAEKALNITRQNKIFGILAWGLDSRGETWECEVYEFSFDGEGSLDCKLIGDKTAIEVVVSIAAEGFIPLTAENFLSVFFPLKDCLEELKKIFARHLKDERIRTLYEVYSNALQVIYGKGNLNESKIEELFIIHTIIQMIAVAVLNKIKEPKFQPGELEILTGSGRDFSISLPFLEWWYKLSSSDSLDSVEKGFFEKLSLEIGNKVLAFNWEEKTRDIFRLIYEAFIEEEDRRQFGEYYTPPWLVNFTLEKLGSLKDKLIIDPFCGSGTFLDYAFRKKVQEGEDPDKAYKELLGFDINPLAVFLARAELTLSYFYLAGNFPSVPPQIFYVNSIEALNKHSIGEMWITEKGKEKPLFLYKISELADSISVGRLISLGKKLSLQKFMEFENSLNYLLRRLEQELQKGRSRAVKVYDEFVKKLKNKKIEWADYFDALNRDSIIDLVEKYGDGVWSITITSLYAIEMLFLKREEREVYIVSNPPWIPLPEIKGEYGKFIRDKVKQYFPFVPSQAYAAGDVASLLLRAWVDYGKKVAFVMSSKVTYDNSLHGIGKLLTYEAVKKNCTIYFVDYDAFKHGMAPSVVIYGTGEDRACRVKPTKTGITKDLEQVPLKLTNCESYEEYIKNLKLYLTQDAEELARKLKVSKVYKMGSYIRGLFGGEKKRGKQSYAGLVLKDVKRDIFPYKIRLWNTESFVELEDDELIKKVIYVGRIYPFWTSTYECILSDEGERHLKEVLENFAEQNIKRSDREKIKKLIEEVQQSSLLKLKRNKWYVVSRADRTFVAVALKGSGNEVPESHVSLMEMDLEEEAFYYSGALNYLVWKVEKGFIRHQFARPFLALAVAGIVWQGEPWQYDIAEISMRLHLLIDQKRIFEKLPRGSQVQAAIRLMMDDEEIWMDFKEAVEIFDKHIDSQNLKRALSLIKRF